VVDLTCRRFDFDLTTITGRAHIRVTLTSQRPHTGLRGGFSRACTAPVGTMT